MQPDAHCVVNRRCALLAVDQWSSAPPAPTHSNEKHSISDDAHGCIPCALSQSGVIIARCREVKHTREWHYWKENVSIKRFGAQQHMRRVRSLPLLCVCVGDTRAFILSCLAIVANAPEKRAQDVCFHVHAEVGGLPFHIM